MSSASLPAAQQPTPSHFTHSGSPARPMLVLLHGLGMSRWMWQPQMVPLGEYYYTLAPDLPGVSGSAATSPFSVATAADAVIALIRQQGYQGAHVCGLSLGAVIALEVALRAPDLTSSLVLSGGQVHPNSLVMALQHSALARASERQFLKPPALLVRKYPDLVETAVDDLRTVGKQRLLDALDALGRIDYRQRLHDISAPTLVLCGSRDWPNRRAARALRRAIPRAKLRIVGGVGHVWNLEEPDRFTRTLLEFLQELDACKHAALS
jgi:3-oxoadipate enol-lactonase